VLEQLLKELDDLKDAKSLLERVYLSVGPYGERPIPDGLRQEINSYFKFDDSE